MNAPVSDKLHEAIAQDQQQAHWAIKVLWEFLAAQDLTPPDAWSFLTPTWGVS